MNIDELELHAILGAHEWVDFKSAVILNDYHICRICQLIEYRGHVGEKWEISRYTHFKPSGIAPALGIGDYDLEKFDAEVFELIGIRIDRTI